jgi:hypothetical protein
MRPLGNDTVTILRAPLVSVPRDGSLVRDWDNATTTSVTKCNVQPFPMAEKLVIEENRDREYVRSAYRVHAPAGTRVEHTDRVIYNGDTYDVFGHMGEWHRFSGKENHVTFIIRLREG